MNHFFGLFRYVSPCEYDSQSEYRLSERITDLYWDSSGVPSDKRQEKGDRWLNRTAVCIYMGNMNLEPSDGYFALLSSKTTSDEDDFCIPDHVYLLESREQIPVSHLAIFQIRLFHCRSFAPEPSFRQIDDLSVSKRVLHTSDRIFSAPTSNWNTY